MSSSSDGRQWPAPARSCSGPAPAPPRPCCSPRASASSGALGAAREPNRNVAGMNIVLFLTDQERALQHFPQNWLRQNLPGMRRLRRHGLSFERAFTNACMCSPARSTLMSGYFPAQHGVKYTLEENMPASEYPQVELPTELANLATVMRAAGYNVVYKGKWHCSKPAGSEAVPADLQKYGFLRWNPPDAGANQTVPEAGGGFIDNDGRFIEAVGDPGLRGRGRASVPRLGRGQTAAILHGYLGGQPPRCPLLSEFGLRRSRIRRLLAAGRVSRCPRPTKKTSRPSPRSRKNLCGSST